MTYIATGVQYAALAERSVRTLKRHNPGLPVHIFTDCDVEADCFDDITRISDPHRRSKVDYIYRTPFEQTVFLDADTRIVEDIRGLFDLLERFDLAAAYGIGRGARKMKEKYGGTGLVPIVFPVVNSGVIVFRKCDAVEAFFDDWRSAFHAGGHRIDQITFREALWRSEVRFGVLPPEYNLKDAGYLRSLEKYEITPKILHLKSYKQEPGIPLPGLGRRRKLRNFLRGLLWRARVYLGLKRDI